MTTPKTKYPKTIAAAKRGDVDAWALADAILKEIPWKDTKQGEKDGSREQIAELREELLDQHVDYSEDALRKYRTTAQVFPKGNRFPSCSFTVHHVARTPDVLDIAVARAGDLCPVTVKLVKTIRKELRGEKVKTPDSNDVRIHLTSKKPDKIAKQLMGSFKTISNKEWGAIIAEMDRLQAEQAQQLAASRDVAKGIANAMGGGSDE